MPTMRDWKLILCVPNGHRYFHDPASGGVAVADDSGRYPEETEDGIIWLGKTGRAGPGNAAVDRTVAAEVRLFIHLHSLRNLIGLRGRWR